MKKRSTYEQNDQVSTPLTPICLLMAPESQNMGPPARLDSRRQTPKTLPELPPTCHKKLKDKVTSNWDEPLKEKKRTVN